MHTATYNTTYKTEAFKSTSASCGDFHVCVCTYPFLNTVSVPVTADKAKGLTGGGDLIFISGSLQQAINQRHEKALCQVAVSTSSATTLYRGAQV